MAKTLTGANAVYMLSITDLFDAPQQLQGFAADDVFSTTPIKSAETLRGVDGKMSAGFVFVNIDQNISIQADSDSCDVFDQWYLAQQTARELYFANATIIILAVGTKWTMTKGALTSYMPAPDVKKLLQPRKFEITWESMIPSVA